MFLFTFLINGRDIFSPSTVVCAMFIVSSFFVALNSERWNVKYSIESCLILISGLLVFVIADVFVHYNVLKKHASNANNKRDFTKELSEIKVQRWVRITLIVFNLAVVIWDLVYIMRVVGENLLKLTSYFSQYRYITTGLTASSGHNIESSIILLAFLRLSEASGYICLYILLNNLAVGKVKRLEIIEYVAIVVLANLQFVMASSRSSILQVAAAGLIEWYIIIQRKSHWSKKISMRFIIIGLVILLIGMPTFYYSNSLFGRRPTNNLFDYISTYVGSGVALFDMYIKNPVSQPTVFGEESLTSVNTYLYKLGIISEVKNQNLEVRVLAPGIQSNIYTFFRRPLHDFGLLGMYIFTFAVVGLFAWIYYSKIKYNYNSKGVTNWTMIYGYLFYWIAVSSILQYSEFYIGVGTVAMITAIILGYKLMTNTKFSFGRKE